MARHEYYDDDGTPAKRHCPRCGDTFLGEYGDRYHCGRCSYTEYADE